MNQTFLSRVNESTLLLDTVAVFSQPLNIHGSFRCEDFWGFIAEGRSQRLLIWYDDEHVILHKLSVPIAAVCHSGKHFAWFYGYNPSNDLRPVMGQWDMWVRVGVLSPFSRIFLETWQKPVWGIKSADLFCSAERDTCLFLIGPSPWDKSIWRRWEIYRVTLSPTGLWVERAQESQQCVVTVPAPRGWWWWNPQTGRAVLYNYDGRMVKTLHLEIEGKNDLCQERFPLGTRSRATRKEVFVLLNTLPLQRDPRTVEQFYRAFHTLVFVATQDTLVFLQRHVGKAHNLVRANDRVRYLVQRDAHTLEVWQYFCE